MGNKKSEANLKKFKKGQSGNPLGGKLHNPELRMIKHLTQSELIEIGNLVIKNNTDRLREIAKDPQASVIKVMIASVAVKIISKGDMHALDVLLNRLVGKVKDQVAVTHQTSGRVVIKTYKNGSEVE